MKVKIVEQTLSRLQPGMVVEFQGEHWRVTKVNDCCARLIPLRKADKTFTPVTGPNAGKTISIESSRDAINISPNSEIPIISYK